MNDDLRGAVHGASTTSCSPSPLVDDRPFFAPHEEELEYLFYPAEDPSLNGFFVQVLDEANDPATYGSLRDTPIHWTSQSSDSSFLFDFDPYTYEQCVDAPVHSCEAPTTPNVVHNLRQNEVEAYRSVTRIAKYYYQTFGFELDRAHNTTPTIHVHVNSRKADEGGGGLTHANIGDPSLCTTAENASENVGQGGACFLDVYLGNSGASEVFSPAHGATATYTKTLIQQDYAKDTSVALHEFGHAILWDQGLTICDAAPHRLPWIKTQYDCRWTAAVQEGTADFYAMDFLARQGTVTTSDVNCIRSTVLSPWESYSRDVSNTKVYPQDLVPPSETPEEHQEGEIWSGAWWELRSRAARLKASGVPNADRGIDDVSLLAFWFPTYGRSTLEETSPDLEELPGVVLKSSFGFQNGLLDIIAADHARTASRYTYEILAAFAKHGIQLEDALAVVVGDPIASSPADADVSFQLYSGTNNDFRAIISPDHRVIAGTEPPVFQGMSQNAICLVSHPDPSGSCTEVSPPTSMLPSSPPFEQLASRIVVGRALIDALPQVQLAGTSAVVPLYISVETQRVANGFISDWRASHIPGAGQFVAHHDDPFVLYLTSSVPSCQCGVDGRSRGSIVFPLAVVGLVALIRRRRAT